MARPSRDVPPPLELLCLRALWTLQEGNVREVRQIVCESRPLAYTTIMTVLDRLVRKGKLVRRKAGRAFIYSPQASRDGMRRAAIQELLENFFDGSEEELLRFLRPSEAQASAAAAAAVAAPSSKPSPEPEPNIDTVLL